MTRVLGSALAITTVMSNIGVLMARFPITAIRLAFALFVTFLGFLSNASATNIVFNNAGEMVGSYVGTPSKVADWIVTRGAVGGATSTANFAVVSAAGDLALVGSARWTAAQLARVARVGVRSLGPLGVAATAYELYGLVKDSGLTPCPPPDFFCKPDASSKQPIVGGWKSSALPDYTNQNFPSLESTGQARMSLLGGYETSTLRCVHQPVTDPQQSDYGVCYAHRLNRSTEDTLNDAGTGNKTCPTGYYYSAADAACLSLTPKLVPVSDPELEKSVGDKASGNPDYGPSIVGAASRDSSKQPGLFPPNLIAPPDLAVTVSGSPKTGPESVVSTRTFPNGDGSTSTETIKQQVTVTPTKTGGDTIADSNTTFPSSTTITTTTVNNTTNVTTTSTQIINPPPNSDGTNRQPGKEPETGPKECGSPGKPKCSIDEAGTPTSPGTALDAPKAALDKTVTDATAQINSVPGTARDTSWKFSFALPSGCTPYTMFLNIVIDYCQFQPIIHDVMSMVWYAATFFAIVGMFGRAARNS